MTIPMLMTTSEPVPAADSGGMTEGEAAALYRLMTWLSAGVPGRRLLLFQRHRMGVEAGDITDAASLRDWLAAMLTDGSESCDVRVAGARASAAFPRAMNSG